MKLPLDRAARDMSGAIDFLASHDAVRGDGVGVVGFCMGGGLALMLACQRPDQVKAVVPYYGVIAWGDAQPDYGKLVAAVHGHYAENDEFFPVDQARQLEQQLKDMGHDVEFFYYPDASHGFANEDRGDAYEERSAREAWVRTLEFLRAKLG
jgi:carboxymethylenebutenolidase